MPRESASTVKWLPPGYYWQLTNSLCCLPSPCNETPSALHPATSNAFSSAETRRVGADMPSDRHDDDAHETRSVGSSSSSYLTAENSSEVFQRMFAKKHKRTAEARPRDRTPQEKPGTRQTKRKPQDRALLDAQGTEQAVQHQIAAMAPPTLPDKHIRDVGEAYAVTPRQPVLGVMQRRDESPAQQRSKKDQPSENRRQHNSAESTHSKKTLETEGQLATSSIPATEITKTKRAANPPSETTPPTQPVRDPVTLHDRRLPQHRPDPLHDQALRTPAQPPEPQRPTAPASSSYITLALSFSNDVIRGTLSLFSSFLSQAFILPLVKYALIVCLTFCLLAALVAALTHLLCAFPGMSYVCTVLATATRGTTALHRLLPPSAPGEGDAHPPCEPLTWSPPQGAAGYTFDPPAPSAVLERDKTAIQLAVDELKLVRGGESGRESGRGGAWSQTTALSLVAAAHENVSAYHALMAEFEADEAARVAWLGQLLMNVSALDRQIVAGLAAAAHPDPRGMPSFWPVAVTVPTWLSRLASLLRSFYLPDPAVAAAEQLASLRAGINDTLAMRREQLVRTQALVAGLARTQTAVCQMGALFEEAAGRAGRAAARGDADGGGGDLDRRRRERERGRSARDGGRLVDVLCLTFRSVGRRLPEWMGKMKEVSAVLCDSSSRDC
ncbi:hypothetical protein CONLIGDRAFT_699801 [Coniochaeta ligniaria NRRL 30616]|uniref:Uncharacterized protein n=1 Tax=Coniochaeta ligniaria NRRL 30616 TaxID=1408157 RepID=A0A1J7I4G1_9PEZI|nr:hypothetical protein CONLIGDRAFT_699801 [Coniochaeta ligniaria NRRL 30616]